MATATGKTADKVMKPDYIIVEELDGDKGTYILEDVIQDTTSISQDDPETTDIECETSDSPILSIVKVGKFQFAAELADTQKDMLKALMGFTIDGDKAYAPTSYTKKYVKVAVAFKNGGDGTDQKPYTYKAFVVPNLQLNSKLTIESLSSNLARIALAGTAMDGEVNGKKTPFYVDDNYTIPSAS